MLSDATRIPRGEAAYTGRRKSHPVWGDTADRYDPDNVDLSVFDKMRRTDETIKAGLQFVKLAAVSKLGEFQHEDEKVKEFVDTAFKMMKGTLEGVISDLLSAIWAGFSVAELVYDLIPSGPWKGRAYYKKIKVLHPLSIWPNGLEHDGFGNVERIVQGKGTSDEVVLEKGKFIHFAYDGGGGIFGSPWGQSTLRSVHRWWFAKDLFLKLWYMYLEKFSIPLAIGFAPQGMTRCPVDGEDEEWSTVMYHMLQTWNTKTEMVFPVPFDRDGNFAENLPRVQTLSPQPGSAEIFPSFLSAANTGILLGILVPSLAVSEAQFGTRAQAVVHLDAFFAMLEDLQRTITDLLIEQIVRPLLELNFSNLDDYGQWVPQPLTAEDMTKWGDTFFKLAESGAIDATDLTVQAWVRSKFAPDLEIEVKSETAVGV